LAHPNGRKTDREKAHHAQDGHNDSDLPNDPEIIQPSHPSLPSDSARNRSAKECPLRILRISVLFERLIKNDLTGMTNDWTLEGASVQAG
jgi:hypothetical protein